jgi:hypothetical protein
MCVLRLVKVAHLSASPDFVFLILPRRRSRLTSLCISALVGGRVSVLSITYTALLEQFFRCNYTYATKRNGTEIKHGGTERPLGEAAASSGGDRCQRRSAPRASPRTTRMLALVVVLVARATSTAQLMLRQEMCSSPFSCRSSSASTSSPRGGFYLAPPLLHIRFLDLHLFCACNSTPLASQSTPCRITSHRRAYPPPLPWGPSFSISILLFPQSIFDNLNPSTPLIVRHVACKSFQVTNAHATCAPPFFYLTQQRPHYTLRTLCLCICTLSIF